MLQTVVNSRAVEVQWGVGRFIVWCCFFLWLRLSRIVEIVWMGEENVGENATYKQTIEENGGKVYGTDEAVCHRFWHVERLFFNR